jgi:hypothetical protein
MVGITRVGKPYFRPHLQGPNFDPFKLLKPHDAETQNRPNSTSVPAIPEESAHDYQEALTYLAGPPSGRATSRGEANKNQSQTDVDRGPFSSWHRRKVVLSTMGRVTIWVQYGLEKAVKISFSAYGQYLQEIGDKFIDFNEKGISIVSADGKELWHKSVEQFRLAKGGSLELLLHHKHELNAQRNTTSMVI